MNAKNAKLREANAPKPLALRARSGAIGLALLQICAAAILHCEREA